MQEEIQKESNEIRKVNGCAGASTSLAAGCQFSNFNFKFDLFFGKSFWLRLELEN